MGSFTRSQSGFLGLSVLACMIGSSISMFFFWGGAPSFDAQALQAWLFSWGGAYFFSWGVAPSFGVQALQAWLLVFNILYVLFFSLLENLV